MIGPESPESISSESRSISGETPPISENAPPNGMMEEEEELSITQSEVPANEREGGPGREEAARERWLMEEPLMASDGASSEEERTEQSVDSEYLSGGGGGGEGGGEGEGGEGNGELSLGLDQEGVKTTNLTWEADSEGDGEEREGEGEGVRSVIGESDGGTPEQQEQQVEEGGRPSGGEEEREREGGEDEVGSAQEAEEEEKEEEEEPTEEPDDVPTFTEFSQRKRMEQSTPRQRPVSGQLPCGSGQRAVWGEGEERMV